VTKTPLRLLALSALLLPAVLLAACARGAATEPTPTPSPAAVLPAVALVAPVYLIRQGQVWRLERDGRTQQQITAEPAGVESLDVSPLDNSLVYLTANGLVRTGPRGEDRRVLLQGPSLPPVDDELAARNSREWIRGRVSTPVFAPDGSRIAYVHNGLRTMAVDGSGVQMRLPNDPIPDAGEVRDARVIRSIAAWSPDGASLVLISFKYPVASVLYQEAIILGESAYLYPVLRGGTATFGWSVDSQTLFAANPRIGGMDALLACTVADGRCTMIGEDIPARRSFFYAYPHAAGPDQILVFMGSSTSPAEAPDQFNMIRLQTSGYGRTDLRQDGYAIRTALWAPDGSGALIVTADDRLVWLPAGPGPAVPLPAAGDTALHWAAGGVD